MNVKLNFKAIAVLGLIVIIAIVATLLLINKGKKESLYESQAGKALSDVEGRAPYTDIAGAPVSLEDYLGQNLIVHSWASWCPQCVEQLTLFKDVVIASPNTKLLAINRGEDAASAERFLNHYNLWSDVTLILDPEDHFYSSVGGYAMPETLIFGKDGEIKEHFRGVVTKEILESALKTLEE